MSKVQVSGICRICFEEKSSCISLFETVLEKYLPSVIEYCSGVQISALEEPNALACSECAVAMIQAENIIKKFRASHNVLQQTHLGDYAKTLVEYVGNNEFEENIYTPSHYSDSVLSLDDGSRWFTSESFEGNAEIVQPMEKAELSFNNLAKDVVTKADPKKEHSTMTFAHRKDFHFFCDMCSFETYFATYFRNHMMQVHEVEKPRIFKCTHCPEAYVEHRSLREHVAHVHECVPRLLKFLCSECGKRFGKYSHLVRHSYVHNPEGRPVQCEVCPMRFVNQSSVKRHMIASHSNVKPYGCEICGKSFGVIYGLKAHLKRVHCKRGYECPNCKKKFRLNKSLDSHIALECHI